MKKSVALGISRCILGAPNRAAFGSGQLRWRSGTRPWPWLSGGARNPGRSRSLSDLG
ncbi:MAG: hypothetical protein ACREYE_13860 [Gammaproteobacteria bacterium]